MTVEAAGRPSGASGRHWLWPVIGTAVVVAVFVGLGGWQLQRLAWKTALIRTIGTRTTLAPVGLPPREAWSTLDPADYAYRHVSLTGTFDHTHEARVFRPLGQPRGRYGGLGDLILTPFALEGGGTVIVNRGFVPDDRLDPATRAAGQVAGPLTISGLMREPEPRNPFTPDDQPQDHLWYTRDPASIAAAFGLKDAAPFTVDEDAAAIPGGLPQGGETVLDIPNSHLSYALTWFGLALGAAGVGAVSVWRTRKPPSVLEGPGE